MNSMLSWMEGADNSTAWNRSNSYNLLDSAANSVGGTLSTHWDSAKVTHGIDHLSQAF